MIKMIKLLLSSTRYYTCAGSAGKERKVQRALYQYVYS